MSSTSKNRISVQRILWGAGAVAISLCSLLLYDSITEEAWKNAPGIVVTVFSILSGFSITVLTLFGAVVSKMEKVSKAILSIYWDTYRAKLYRQIFGCVFCIIALTLALAASFMPENVLLRKTMLVITTGALCVNISLPFTIMSFYTEMYEFTIKCKDN